MAKYINMPRLGLTMEEGVITSWVKKEGDHVEKGDIIAEIESDKSVVPFESPESGTILKLLAEESDTLDIYEPIAIIGEPGENIDDLAEGDAAEAADKPAAEGNKTEAGDADYDIAVIGAGPGGYVAAIKAAQLGKKVCIAEKEHFGGTCLNVGCIPTKALLKSAEMFNEVKEAAAYGVTGVDAAALKINLNDVQKRKQQVVGTLVNGVEGLLRKNGVTVKRGAAEFVDAGTIKVGDETIKADNIIIAAGSAPKMLPVDISSEMPIYTSTEILDMTKAPKKIAVIGGGVIGVELAYFLANIGVEVTIVEFLDRILPMVDKEITDLIEKQFAEMGIKINTSAKVTAIEKDGVAFEKAGEKCKAECDAVLMAVGRRPYTEGLKLENAGVHVERGAVVTDDTMATNVKNIYAIGDINGKVMLAHTASMEGIVAVENICGHNSKMDYSKIPSAIYIKPEVASIGLTEEQAKEKYGKIKVGKFPMMANGKALIEGETRGLVKIITDEKHLEIVGAHFYCIHATDMIAEMSVAMNLECTADELVKMIHPHPTVSEVVHEAAHAAESKAIHC